MKELDKYLKSQLVENQDEEITRALFKSHFDKELRSHWSKELEDKYNISAPPSVERKDTTSRRQWMLFAASIVLGLISVFLYQNKMQPDALQLTEAHLAKKYTHIGLKKGRGIDELRTIAIDAYNINDYDKTIALYEKIIGGKDSTIEDFFFCGLSYLYSNQSAKAIPLLQKGLMMPPTSDLRSKEIIRWYLALAHIKAEDLQEAKKELTKIASSKGAKQKLAEELLKCFQ